MIGPTGAWYNPSVDVHVPLSHMLDDCHYECSNGLSNRPHSSTTRSVTKSKPVGRSRVV
jgi:hypothetical protein